MKETVLKIAQLILVAVGGGLVTNGVASESEVAAIVGGVLGIAGAVWAILERSAAAKAAEAAKAVADTAGKITPVLLVGVLALTAATPFAGCNLTSAEKEAVSSVLINIAKMGLNAGLNALAKKVPELAGFVPSLQARFQVTFSDATATASPSAFAAAIREDVLVTVAEPDAQEKILGMLSDAIGAEVQAHESATASGAHTAGSAEELAQVEFARRVAASLSNQ